MTVYKKIVLLKVLFVCIVLPKESQGASLIADLDRYDNCLESQEISEKDIRDNSGNRKLKVMYIDEISASGRIERFLKKHNIDGYVFGSGHRDSKRLLTADDLLTLQPNVYLRTHGVWERLFGNSKDVPYHLVLYNEKRLLIQRALFDTPPPIHCEELEDRL